MVNERLTGLDVARALAIFGMVIVNYKVVMVTGSDPGWLVRLAGLLEGRASALFVVLAGIGISLLTRRARSEGDRQSIRAERARITKRGLLLIAIGLSYTPVWPADILHFYGFYFLIAAWLFPAKDRVLLLVGTGVVLSFPVLLMFLDYEKGWDWDTLVYHGFWTVDGMVRHILFNGFHPVLPWAAFLIFGMWLGRLDLTDRVTGNRMLAWGLGVWISTELVFRGLGAGLQTVDAGEAAFLLTTSIMPPMPQYLIAAGSLAVAVIAICIRFSRAFSEAKPVHWLTLTGRQSLTLYVAHVIVGMGWLEALGRLENQSIQFALFCAAAFCITAMIYSVLWAKYFDTGPLEWLFRSLSR